ISVDYLMNVFETTRQTILNDLKELRNKGYNVKKVDLGVYTIK
ncbi:MAG: HTH domain-containing protein, partial [Spirochaetaceae bacterium]|nr:HTH domain-containing protein [Spirochaetaceae bacterium]